MTDVKANLYKCFCSLDVNFFENFTSSINKRIVFQKYGLLFATIFGLELGSFSLYIHGPYNSSLATAGYEFAKNTSGINISSINFSNSSNEIINFLRQNLSISDNNTDYLEVFSTYFYLKNYSSLTEEDIINKTKTIKKDIIRKNNIELSEVENRYNAIRDFINNTAKQLILA